MSEGIASILAWVSGTFLLIGVAVVGGFGVLAFWFESSYFDPGNLEQVSLVPLHQLILTFLGMGCLLFLPFLLAAGLSTTLGYLVSGEVRWRPESWHLLTRN